ncbi:hypothetical protein EVAR_8875_1 [Eumeta japonica]|uniref:RNA-directed DNA polymerase from mobile element jockey n=1 Tax=Eumeta variegata TaxID=151549 RepID=A0A4C1U067_EUMVA|nr:hypothetical protein EVAR_8875_1 [Eumeta japonica]
MVKEKRWQNAPHAPTDVSRKDAPTLGYSIRPSRKASNSLVSPLVGLHMSVGGDDHLHSSGSHARLRRENPCLVCRRACGREVPVRLGYDPRAQVFVALSCKLHEITANENRRKLSSVVDKIGFSVLSLLTPTGFPDNNRHKSDILDIALVKRVALRLEGIETFQCLNSDHCSVLLKLGPLIGDKLNPVKTITNWKKLSFALEKIDTPALRDIPNDIVLTDEINHSTGVHHPRLLVKALNSKGYEPTPALKKPDNIVVLDDRDIAECLANSLHQQCSHTSSPYDPEHVHRIKEEVRQKISLDPKNDLDPVSLDEVQFHIKKLNTRKAPGLDGINNKAIKFFSAANGFAGRYI